VSYRVELTPAAQRQIDKLPRSVQRQVIERIAALANEPRPAGCVRLSGEEVWRVRAGDYRVVYAIEDAALLVTIVKAAHRRDVYRDL
jgi:mRNA interferase RelE/StbE